MDLGKINPHYLQPFDPGVSRMSSPPMDHRQANALEYIAVNIGIIREAILEIRAKVIAGE